MTRTKQQFAIEGMTCQACATRIEKILNKKKAVFQTQVNFASERAQVIFDAQKLSVQDIIGFIEKAGFKAFRVEELTTPHAVKMTPRLWGVFLINIPFLFGMAGMLVGQSQWMLPPLWQFVLASIVQLVLATPFYQRAWASLKGGVANMDVLVTVGTVATYLYSVYMLFFSTHVVDHDGEQIYFEVGVMVIGCVSLGKYWEAKVKTTTLNSLHLLWQLFPSMVQRQRDNAWEHISRDQVQIGDRLRANHGDRIVADGIVLQGNAWIDESHLTGEACTEEKIPGSRILAGSLVNDGSIIYQAQQLGEQTLLGDMVAALSEAQGTKAPIAQLADKVSAVFVPAVIVIAVLTFGIMLLLQGDMRVALTNAVAVLVIACPCALGLATPAAMMVGMGEAAKLGICFKDATVMEEAAHVNTVVFDKTGTLTEGKPQVVASCMQRYDISHNDLLRIAASVEQGATHPLAKALVEEACKQQLTLLEPQHVEVMIGHGLRATLAGIGEVCVGSPAFCDLPIHTLQGEVWQTASVLAVSIEGQAVGAFALADALKEDSRSAIERLKAHDIEIYVMSGDHQQVVSHVAQQLGVQQAFGQLSPQDKVERIQALKAAGKIVAMVGDGINDSPALAVSHVSFAMKGGSDVAEHTASATLMRSSANQVVEALWVSRVTLHHIKQNLFLAFVYNALGIPLAALGFLNPILAGAAMALSSISVLLNALRLKYLVARYKTIAAIQPEMSNGRL